LTRTITDVGHSISLSDGQSIFALPCTSDVDLFGYRDSVIDLDTQVSHGALDLGVAIAAPELAIDGEIEER
jgi:hypothetical protein